MQVPIQLSIVFLKKNGYVGDKYMRQFGTLETNLNFGNTDHWEAQVRLFTLESIRKLGLVKVSKPLNTFTVLLHTCFSGTLN